jgi:hypothetical protein
MARKLAAPIPRVALTPPEAAAAIGVGEDFFTVHVRPELAADPARSKGAGPRSRTRTLGRRELRTADDGASGVRFDSLVRCDVLGCETLVEPNQLRCRECCREQGPHPDAQGVSGRAPLEAEPTCRYCSKPIENPVGPNGGRRTRCAACHRERQRRRKNANKANRE